MSSIIESIDDRQALETLIEENLGKTFLSPRGLPAAVNPYPIGERCLEMEEHAHLLAGGAVIDWLFRTEIKRKNGRFIAGTCYMPSVQGDLRDLFDFMLERLLERRPTFLIVLSWDYWRDATPLQREILCFHELKHAVQATDYLGVPRFHRETGEPIWGILSHDLEEFDAVARRYGVHDESVRRFLQSISDHAEEQSADE